MHVRFYHNHRRVFEGTATQVVLPGADGELSVWSLHAPMLCVLAEGEVQIDDARRPIRGGLARVARNTVTIVAS
jgi:F-type H+-transporting ATPase subunit epsilon